MTRLIAIMALVLAGLPGLGAVVSGALAPNTSHDCREDGCHIAVVESPCCSETPALDYCPMSGGPCRCGAAPLPDPQPRPDAPLPGSERDQVVTASRAALRTVPILTVVAPPPGVGAGRLSLLAGMTHNDIQAFLGAWRT